MITAYQGQQITVMGLGRFGGGVGVARFLADRGADVLVTDTLPPEELKDSMAQLADLERSGSVTYRLGEHNVSDFTTCDLVVVNPAVKPDNRFVRAAQAAGIPITSEIRLLVKHLPNRLRTIGITGSAGKSTTTAMTSHILRKVLEQASETPFGDVKVLTPKNQDATTPRRERRVKGPGVWMGGNIGGSLLPLVEDIRDDDWVVLELSSFMLEGLREDQWSPHIAVITNISPNHLDWHGSMERYVAAKFGIMEHQQNGDFNVINHELLEEFDYGSGLPMVSGVIGGVAYPDHVTMIAQLPGLHNRANLSCAVKTAETALFNSAKIKIPEMIPRAAELIAGFRGLSHRLEFVGEFNGLKCYNDSKSTTPEAAGLAIESFEAGRVRIILGGYDKGSDFGELAALAAGRCAGVYTVGATGDAIAGLVEEAMRAESRTPKGLVVERCGTLEVAVERAMRDAQASASGGGEVVVVLSPGCASWDQFTNYEERGARFVELVKGCDAGSFLG